MMMMMIIIGVARNSESGLADTSNNRYPVRVVRIGRRYSDVVTGEDENQQLDQQRYAEE